MPDNFRKPDCGREELVLCIKNVSERKRVEEALKKSEEKLRTIFEFSPVDIALISLDGTLLDCNQATVKVHGFVSKEELIGKNCFTFIDQSCWKKAQKAWDRVLKEGSVKDLELTLLRGDQSRFCVLLSANLLKDSQGNPDIILTIISDISKLKQMEQELRQSEQKYKDLFKYAPAGIFEVDFRHKRFTSVNDAICHLLGYSRQELLEINPFDILDEQGKTTFQARINQWLTGKKPDRNVEYKLKTKDGHEIFVVLNVSFTVDENGDPIGAVVIGHDITERKRMEEALYEMALIAQQQADELNAIISSIAEGVIIYDISGNIIRINDFASKVFEYTDTDFNSAGKKQLLKVSMYKPDGKLYKTKESPLYRALHGDTVINEEIIITRKNSEEKTLLAGTFAPICSNNNILGVVFTFTDITERKRKADEILASERELLQVTLNSLKEGVVAADRQQQIIFINEAAANLTGYFPIEAIGKPLSKILYICNDLSSEPVVFGASQKEFQNLILVTRDLKEIPVALNSSPIKTPDGANIGMVTVFQDISEKRKIDRELLKADKLESLGILAGGIAHDFNNILAAILSNIQLAMLKIKKHEDIQIYLSNTVETARKASELTRQLLTFSRGGAPVKKDTSLIELIKDTAEFVLRGSKTKVKFAIPDDLWTASVDEGQISQVIHNLVLNAKQAMLRGGIIHIVAENIIVGDNLHFNPGKYVRITIKDQGTGIPKEYLSKIFDPFFTTKKEGNGLGLAISYSITTRHNGYIEVESQKGTGTSFFIYLPATEMAAVLQTESVKKTAVSGSGYKILLMDDERKILEATGEMLKYFGYRVVMTTDGIEAITAYKQAINTEEPFDAVIMDLTVPGGMGGQEVIAYLRDINPKIKAIVSSGYANDPILADYERYGFTGKVSKPYKIDELIVVLHEVINPAQLPLELSYE